MPRGIVPKGVIRRSPDELVGKAFGYLLVESVAPKIKHRSCVFCKCLNCEKTVAIRASHIFRGKAKSCGCAKWKLAAEKNRTHGKTKSVIYRTWASIKRRCCDPKSFNYARYGARGIYLDASWKDFTVFYRDMGDPPSDKHSIERKDNDGPYARWNCVWALPYDQSRNKRSNVRITIGTETKVLQDWLKHFAIAGTTVYNRVKKGMSWEEALTMPITPRNLYGQKRKA